MNVWLLLAGCTRLVVEVVGVYEDGQSALGHEGPVDVWLLDIRLPDLSGLAVARALRERHGDQQPKLLMMTVFNTEDVIEAVGAGVDGFVHKDAFLMNIAAAIRAVHAGYQVGNRTVTATIARHLSGLAVVDPERARRVVRDNTDREILDLVLGNHSIRDIAAVVHLSPSGVHKRLTRIFQRAGVQNQRALVSWLHDRLPLSAQARSDIHP